MEQFVLRRARLPQSVACARPSDWVWTDEVAGVTIVAALALVAAGAASPPSWFLYQSAAVHVALWTASGLAAVVAGQLLFVHFSQESELRYLLAGAGLVVLGITDLGFAVPTSESAARFLTWFPLLIRLAGMLLFVGAAFVPARRIARRHRAVVILTVLVAGYVTLAELATWLLRASLPAPHNPALSPSLAQALGLSAPWLIVALQLAATATLAVASAGFLLRARAARDSLLLWLAFGAAIGCFGRASDLVLRPNDSQWVLSDDLLRLAFFSLVVAGGLRGVAAHRNRAKEAAIVSERERLARDIHDGIAQELAFIIMQARLARQGVGGDSWADIADAADRALTECRRSMRILFEGKSSGAERVVSAARDVSDRAGLRLDVDVDHDIELSLGETEALVRIVQEAASNAVRHGRAHTLALALRRDTSGGSLFSVADDGLGFDPMNLRRRSGYGLSGIQDRVGELGGRVRLESKPASGTMIEVRLP